MAARLKTKGPDQGPIVEQSDLSSIINDELRNSLTYDQTQISSHRARTLEYVRGIMPDLPGRPNGSQQTSRDISDVISWMLPGIMRTMTASDQMVRYDSVKDEPEEWSEQATSYANWSFFRDHDGYRNLYNGTYDSLAMGNGVAICYFDPEQTKTEQLRGQTPEDIAGLIDEAEVSSVEELMAGQGSIRILSQRAGEPKQVEDEFGQTSIVPTIDLKIQRVTSKGRICHSTGKPENLLINSAATTLEDARFVAYLHSDYTRSDLLEMGFDKDKVESLSSGPNFARNQVELARRYELNSNWRSPVRSGDRIDTYECYVRADADGDGIAELLQVWYAGTIGAGVVLGWEYWEDDLPFTDIPCYPIPHRWDAESVADRTMDIQRVNTVLIRALLDSTYASVVPQRAVVEGSVLNPDALVNPRFGSTLWIKKGMDASTAIVPQEIPYTGDKALAAMQYMGDIITKRTGISRSTMALDPEALNNQTATASQNLRDAGYSQVELVARNMAELGWSKYFAKFLKLAVKHKILARIPAPKQMDQKFQQVKAEQWDENMAVSINTGLGTGSRDRDMAMVNVMLGNQMLMAKELRETGLPTGQAKALQLMQKVMQSARLLAESAGIKNASEHYPDFTDEDVLKMGQEADIIRQAGDPKQQTEQVKQQGIQAQQASDQQIAQIKGQAEMQKAQAELQIKTLQEQGEVRQQQQASQINDLEIRLRAATEDAKNNVALKTAAWDNLTKIEVARISASKNSALEPGPVESELEGIVGVRNPTAQAIDELKQHMIALHQTMAAPTEIVRGPDGRPIGARKVIN